MKSLDERLSEITSPFEDNEQTQEEITGIQYLKFRTDSLVDAIGKKTGYQEFDLFLDEVIDELSPSDMILLLTDCINKLKGIYSLEVLADHIFTHNIIEEDQESIITLIQFFVYNKWLDSMISYIPMFEVDEFKNRFIILKKIKEAYLSTQEEIIKDVNIHPLVRYHFKYCPRTEGEKTLMVFIFKDVAGVMSQQIILGKGDR